MGKYGETYGLDGILRLWEVGRLTTEQAIGQILLLIRQMDTRLQELESLADAQRASERGGEKRG
jgi:hypothetical protein